MEITIKIYFVFSKNYSDLLLEKQVPIIISYGRLSRNLKIPRGFKEIMVDSGGYQMQSGTGTRDITREAYALWLNLTLPEHPELKYYFNLDVWREPEKTLANQIYMESEGLHPIPIFHVGTELEHLEYYCGNYDYVAIGGIANVRVKNKLMLTLSQIFQKFPNTKFHALGIGLSGINIFKSLRPHSVDFSTWLSPARYGHDVILDDRDYLKEIVLPQKIADEFRINKSLEREYVSKVIDRIVEFGLKISDSNDPYTGLLF